MGIRILPESWVLPAIEPLNEAFFTAGRIALQACAHCGAVQHPPEEVCRACQAVELEVREVEGAGTIYSYTVAHHPVHPALADAVPYAVVLVSLEEHPHVRIVGNVLNVPPERVRIGQRVRAVFEKRMDEEGRALRLPQWEVAELR